MSSSSEKERQRNPFLIPDVGRIDPRGIGSVYGIPQKKEPDYIPFNSRGRDFLPRLCFNAGLLWLGGFTAGSFYGAREGYIGAKSPQYRIRLNSVLNAVSRRGSAAGNILGVIGFYHTAFVWISDQLELEKITGLQIVTPAFAGFMTGGLFKISAGPRGTALAAGLGTAGSCALWIGGQQGYDFLFGPRGGNF